MSDTVHMGTKELRTELGRRVDAAHYLGEPTVITRNGEPRAVLIPYAEWLKWQETHRVTSETPGDENGQ